MILIAAAFAGLVSGAAITSSNRLVARTLAVDNPPCTSYFTPFTYAGCFDDSGPRVMPNVPDGVDNSKMTPAYCQAACKGKFVFELWPGKLLTTISANNFKYSNQSVTLSLARDKLTRRFQVLGR